MRDYGYELPDDIITGVELHELEPALSPNVTAGLPDPPALARAPRLAARPGWPRRCAATASRSARAPRWSSSCAEGRRLTHVRTAAGRHRGRHRRARGRRVDDRRSRARSASRCRWRPGKGYSFCVRPTVVPSHAILLADVHVGCTPFGDRIRIGGTMEFSGINNRLDRRRIDAIVAGAQASFEPWATPEIEAEWAGMRPITADGLPVLDRAGALDNTYLATGYAHAGRHARRRRPGSAMAEMIATGRRPPLLEPFRLDRFRRIAAAARRAAPQRPARGRRERRTADGSASRSSARATSAPT